MVQRVPVRVALDPKQLAANPLRVGLSMDAEVDVSKQDGKTLADAPRTTPVAADPGVQRAGQAAPTPRCGA